MTSIWKDTFFEYATSEVSLDYIIKDEVRGSVVYKGRGYKLPTDNAIRININKICQNYLKEDAQPYFEARGAMGEWFLVDALKTFGLYTTDASGSEGTKLAEFEFIYDWSYEENDYSQSRSLSKPINGHYTTNMLLFDTWYDADTKEVNIVDDDKNVKTAACGDYAIYYANAFGGWDAFLLEGNCKKTDKITNHKYNKSYDNTTLDFESGRYISEIKTSYELTTHFLSDDEAENLCKNLLGTNNAYLHNLKTDKIMPIVMTNTQNVYKTYKTNGMVSYTITCEESQTKIRK